MFSLLCFAFVIIYLSDLFHNNDSIPCHGSGTFVEICQNGFVKTYVINRRRIVPLVNEKRTILIENCNLQSFPQCCRGVLIYLCLGDKKQIGCISCLTLDKFTVYLWKRRMLYCDRYNFYFPDFCAVTHNQHRCFDSEETFIDLYSCCLLYTSPSPRDRTRSRMPSSA